MKQQLVDLNEENNDIAEQNEGLKEGAKEGLENLK